MLFGAFRCLKEMRIYKYTSAWAFIVTYHCDLGTWKAKLLSTLFLFVEGALLIKNILTRKSNNEKNCNSVCCHGAQRDGCYCTN